MGILSQLWLCFGIRRVHITINTYKWLKFCMHCLDFFSSQSLQNVFISSSFQCIFPTYLHSRSRRRRWANSRRCSQEPSESKTTTTDRRRSIKHQGDCQHRLLIDGEESLGRRHLQTHTHTSISANIANRSLKWRILPHWMAGRQ